MPVYAYQATDQGRRQSGTLTADTPRQARDRLREMGLVIELIDEVKSSLRSEAVEVGAHASVHTRYAGQVARWVHELATMLGVGIPLLEALDTTIAGYRHGRFRRVLMSLRDQVSSGIGLAEAMGRHPDVFDDLSVVLVEVGEHAGTLDESLMWLAEFKDKASRLKNHLANALLYPVIVLMTSFGVSLFLMTFVVPNLLQILLDAGKPLPWPTLIVKGCSDFLIYYWWLVIALLFLLIGGFGVLGRMRAGRLLFGRIQLRLPVIGDLVRKQAVSRVAMVIATLMHGGVSFEKAIRIASGLTRNLVLQDALVQCEQALHTGQGIAQVIEQSQAFPVTAVKVFAVGEQSGNLESMLERLSEDYDYQLTVISNRLLTILEPAVIILLVIIVGFIAFATLLPILEASHVM